MLRVLLISILVFCSGSAMAIYKCDSGGKISYSEVPCPGGNSAILVDRASENPPAPDAAQAGRQAAREKNEATRLEKARHQREAKEEKEQQRIARANAAARKKCAALALRKKWAADDAISFSKKTALRARTKARHAAEKYELECGT